MPGFAEFRRFDNLRRMNVLVLGSGAREHAICHCLSRSRRLDRLFVLPGNAGTAALGTNVEGDPEDIERVLAAARDHRVDFTIVGPEDPLAAGIVDAFEREGRRIFGPTAAAARLEADKAYAKQLMRKCGVPTADARIFAPTQQEILWAQLHGARDEGDRGPRQTGYGLACEYVSTRDEPLVVKASGLAKGKGVFVCDTPAEALAALERLMVRKEFGVAGETVLVEERLTGRECSVMALVDGRTIYVLETAQDYKRLLDGDAGPNTGGMGAYSPAPLDEAVMRQIESQILVPIVDSLAHEGITYKGVLYAGLMLNAGGPRVLEFNCRFGDPEAQVLLMRLKNDLLDVLEAVIEGRLDQITLEWDPRPAVCVVMASGGYPGAYEKGIVINGLPSGRVDVAAGSGTAEGPVGSNRPQGIGNGDSDRAMFHAGTRLESGRPVTSGGRVLAATALGDDLTEARQRAYDLVRQVRFSRSQFRSDIAEIRTIPNLEPGAVPGAAV